jgi:exosortase
LSYCGLTRASRRSNSSANWHDKILTRRFEDIAGLLHQSLTLKPTRQIWNLRNLSVFGILLLTAILFGSPLKAVLSLSFQDDRYLQIAVAPFMSLFLMYWERTVIFPQARFSPRVGIPLLSVATLLCLTVIHWQPPIQEAAGMAPILFAIVLVWMAVFLLFFGSRSFKKALFALCCLFLMIPVPPELMDWMTVELQHGSAATSFQILRLMGIPVFREGMRFMLPGLSIEVAPECSGIHSWLAFVLVAILAARVCLRSSWKILALIASTVPIAIFKNAVRIVVLSSLSVYVDRTIIDSPLHHRGGPVFAIVDLAIFVPLLIAFQRSEIRSRRLNGVMPAAGSSGGLPPSAAKASVR